MDDNNILDEQHPGSRKIIMLKTFIKSSALIFLIVWLVSFCFPLLYIKTGGYYDDFTIYGSNRIEFEPFVFVYKSGFEEFYSILMQFFYVLSLIILVNAKEKRQILYALIAAIINLIFLPLIFVGMQISYFEIRMWESDKIIMPYIGFYSLCALGISLIIFLIFLRIKIDKK